MAYGEYEPVVDAEGNAVILGKGSFGKVYLVTKTRLGRRYALKLLGHQAPGKSSSAHGRFLREVSTFAGLRHTHIVNIADYGECEEGIYYVMDFCEGGSLETLVRNLRRFSVSLTLRLLDKAAAALEYAHTKGLIHRDIKPENLMLLSPAERDDDLPDLIRLIDFGLAKDLSAETGGENVSLTLESQVIGTPLYMSPEQLAGSHVDHRADIFSLGITGWYLLAGPQAFAHLHNGTLIRQDRFSPIPYSSRLPDQLTGKARAVLARMIEKDASRRFQDYRSLREALRSALLEELQATVPAPVSLRTEPLSGSGADSVPGTAGDPLHHYTALTPLGRDPATGGALWSALCAGQSVQLVTAPATVAPALSQLLGRLDVPERPDSVVAYDRAGFSPQHPDFPGSCVCTTRTPAGPDLLTILRNRPRTTLEEAKGLFQQIAEAMDFARPRGLALKFAPGDILLPGLPPAPATPEFSNAPVRLFPSLPGAGGAEPGSLSSALGATVVQHSSIPGTGVPTHRDFAALIYRVLAGREIDPGAFHSTRNYKGIGSLQTKTDAILRDLICGLYPAQSCRALLLALCSAESIRLPERPVPETSSAVSAPVLSGAAPAASVTAGPPAAPMTASVSGSVVSSPTLHDELLAEPPHWRNLPNAARRQLVSCLRDTWDLRSDIDKDHHQATCYSTQSQTHIQQHRLTLKEADEAARDIESCRRTLQDCYFKATQAIQQIRDSSDPAQAEIRKKDVYGLLEIAEQARRDADSHFEFLARLGSRREALLQEAEETELRSKALCAHAARPLPDVPIIFIDAPTQSQCGVVEKEAAAVRALATAAMPLTAAASADSLFGIEKILTDARDSLTQATARWERLRSSIDHLTGKLSRLGESWRSLDQDRTNLQTQIKNLQHAVQFSAGNAARFEREVSGLITRSASTRRAHLDARPEAALVRQSAQEAAAAARRLEEIAGEAATLTTPEQLRQLLEGAQFARDAAAGALSQASEAHRAFTRYAREFQEEPSSTLESPGSAAGPRRVHSAPDTSDGEERSPAPETVKAQSVSTSPSSSASNPEAASRSSPQTVPPRHLGRWAAAALLLLLAAAAFLAWQPDHLRQMSAPVPVLSGQGGTAENQADGGVRKPAPPPSSASSIPSTPPPPPAAAAELQLPAEVPVRSLMPATLTVSDGWQELTRTPDAFLSLAPFQPAGPDKPLVLTFSAEGYHPLLRMVQPVRPGSPVGALEVLLEPVAAPFLWKSDPPEWFSGARLSRLDPPGDPRLALTMDWPSTIQSVPAGRYACFGLWGKIAMPLGEITLTATSAETVLKNPLPTRQRWNGQLDLNPQALLAGPTAPFKSAAAGWNFKVAAPCFLELHRGGEATLHLLTPRIMQLGLLGLAAGSLPGSSPEHTAKNIRTAESALVQSLANEMAAGKSLGDWFTTFWKTQMDTSLARSEEWRTSTFVQSQQEVDFLTALLASPDPWSALENPAWQDLRQNCLERMALQAEILSPEGLKLSGPDKTTELLLAPDGQSARFTGSVRGQIDLQLR